MRFILLDKVIELEVGRKITSVKALSMAEEYLADHFPAFPVLPGVLMLEGLLQTAAMLVRATNQFRQSMIVLQEAQNVKYKSFVKPGNLLRMEAQAKFIEPQSSLFVGTGYVDDRPTLEARLKLRHFNLADEDPAWSSADNLIIEEMKRRAELMGVFSLINTKGDD